MKLYIEAIAMLSYHSYMALSNTQTAETDKGVEPIAQSAMWVSSALSTI